MVQHNVQSNKGIHVGVLTSFADVEGGENIFQSRFNPRVRDSLRDCEPYFPSGNVAKPIVRGFYEIHLLNNDLEKRQVQSSETMSGAPSLKYTRADVGQGVGLTSPEKITQDGCLKFMFNTAPVNSFGIQFYASPDDPADSYPKMIPVTLVLENGDTVTVYAARLDSKGDFPETAGPNEDKGYGYLNVHSKIPFKEIYIGFQSISVQNEYLAKNSIFVGGHIRFHSDGCLMNTDLPLDQIRTIAYNEAVYSNVALLPMAQHTTGAEQSLGIDCVQEMGKVALRADPRSLFAIVFGENAPLYDGAGDPLGKVQGTEQAQNKNSTWMKPMMLHQNTSTNQATIQGMWMGWNRRITDRLALELLGGYTHEKNDTMYNAMTSRGFWGGASIEGWWRQDALGPCIKQVVVFARHDFENIRILPLFNLQAEQQYSGYSLYGLTQFKWVFSLPYNMQLVPYGIFSYAVSGHQDFQETMYMAPGATLENQWMAGDAALFFSRHKKTILVQEGGLTLKKIGNFARLGRWEMWTTAAIGTMGSSSKVPQEVGFVNFTESYTMISEKNSVFYYAPMVGAHWHISKNWTLTMGGRFQKSMPFSKNTSNDPQTTVWSTWFSIQRSF